MKHAIINNKFHLHIRHGIVWLLLVGVVAYTSAQGLYTNKGFVFGHPYFENRNWLSSLNSVDIVASPLFLNSVPSSISFSGNAEKSVTVYIANDSLYLSVGSIFEKSTSCYKKELVFVLPKYLQSPVDIRSQAVLYAIKKASIDTIDVCLSGQNGTIYLLKASTRTNTIIDFSSFILSNAPNSTITSITGSSTSYLADDIGIWVTGSRGLLRFISYNQSVLQGEVIHDIDIREKVVCFGDGYAGTESGSIYSLSGSRFGKVFTGIHPIRSIDKKGAVGSGVVVVQRGGLWQEVYTGSRSFRGHNITANANGVMCELIDSTWECDTLQGGNSQTVLQTIRPESFLAYLNTKTPYMYNKDFPETLTVVLADSENNYQPPVVIHQSGVNSTILNSDEKYTLQNGDPSQFCVDKNLALSDSTYKIILNPEYITIEASAQLGLIDLVCDGCVLRAYSFKRFEQWKPGDSLLIQMSAQKLIIYNGTISLSVTGTNHFVKHNYFLHVVVGDRTLKINVPFALSDIESISAFNLYGKKIPLRYSGNVAIMQQAAHQVITIRVRLVNGTIFATKAAVLAR